MIGILFTLPCRSQSGFPVPPPVRRLFIGGFVLILLFALAGCTREPDNTLEAKKFVELTRSDFSRLKRLVGPAMDSDDRAEKVDAAIIGFLKDPGALAGRPNLGIAVLDSRMNYVAGRSISTEHPDAAPIRTSLRDFSYLKDLFNAAGEGIAHQSLYYQNREIFTVCSAVRSGETTDAYICLFYDAKMFRKVFGFGKPVFARIDFSR